MNNDQYKAFSAGAKKTGTVISAGGDPTIDNKFRSDWNSYVQWLDKKGMKGHPELDNNDLGGKLIDQYRKENPETSVSRDSIVPLQKEFQNYRAWVINQSKVDPKHTKIDVPEEQFMPSLSVVDGIPGQRTTSFSFPDAYLTTFEGGKNQGTKHSGFAATGTLK